MIVGRVEGKVRLSYNHSYDLQMNLSFLARKAVCEMKQKERYLQIEGLMGVVVFVNIEGVLNIFVRYMDHKRKV